MRGITTSDTHPLEAILSKGISPTPDEMIDSALWCDSNNNYYNNNYKSAKDKIFKTKRIVILWIGFVSFSSSSSRISMHELPRCTNSDKKKESTCAWILDQIHAAAAVGGSAKAVALSSLMMSLPSHSSMKKNVS